MFTLWVFVSFSQMLSPWPLTSESSPVVCHSEHQWLIETRTCLDRQQAFHIHLSLACGGVRVHLTSLKLQDCNMQDFPLLPSSLSPNNQEYCCVNACEKALQVTYLCTCSILFMVPSLLCCKTTSALLSLAIIKCTPPYRSFLLTGQHSHTHINTQKEAHAYILHILYVHSITRIIDSCSCLCSHLAVFIHSHIQAVVSYSFFSCSI